MNFMGIVIGMLSFGYIVDRAGRKIGMIVGKPCLPTRCPRHSAAQR